MMGCRRRNLNVHEGSIARHTLEMDDPVLACSAGATGGVSLLEMGIDQDFESSPDESLVSAQREAILEE